MVGRQESPCVFHIIPASKLYLLYFNLKGEEGIKEAAAVADLNNATGTRGTKRGTSGLNRIIEVKKFSMKCSK